MRAPRPDFKLYGSLWLTTDFEKLLVALLVVPRTSGWVILAGVQYAWRPPWS